MEQAKIEQLAFLYLCSEHDGVSIQSIRDYLGHTFEEMTMQYIDYMPRKIAKENDAYFEEEENSLLACMQKGEKHG